MSKRSGRGWVFLWPAVKDTFLFFLICCYGDKSVKGEEGLGGGRKQERVRFESVWI